MWGGQDFVLTAAVEGLTDQVVVERTCAYLGIELGGVYGKRGRAYLEKNIAGYNNAARGSAWLVQIDLDASPCAPGLVADILPAVSPFMCCNVAVREMESWLLGDAEAFSTFFHVPARLIPDSPEVLPDPKAKMVDLCRHSNRKAIRDDVVPRPGSGIAVGPGYVAQLLDYVRGPNAAWRPEVAERSCPSYARLVRKLNELKAL